VAPSCECLRGKGPPDRMLAIPWRRLFLAAFGLNLVVVAVLRDRLLWDWPFCLNYNKRGLCYYCLSIAHNVVQSRSITLASSTGGRPIDLTGAPQRSITGRRGRRSSTRPDPDSRPCFSAITQVSIGEIAAKHQSAAPRRADRTDRTKDRQDKTFIFHAVSLRAQTMKRHRRRSDWNSGGTWPDLL